MDCRLQTEMASRVKEEVGNRTERVEDRERGGTNILAILNTHIYEVLLMNWIQLKEEEERRGEKRGEDNAQQIMLV